MIRIATQDDICKLLPMAREFYKLTPFKEEFDIDSVSGSMTHLVIDETGIIFTDDNFECMLGAMVYPLWMNRGVSIAMEMFWWSENPRFSTQLLNKFEEWGTNKGASYFELVRLESNEPNRLDNLYRRKGYRAMEHVYLKEV